MSTLKGKYKVLVDLINTSDIQDLMIEERDGQLYIDGKCSSADLKNKLWDILNQLDPNYISGDVKLNLSLLTKLDGIKATVITESTNLNIRQGPGIELPIIGKAAKSEIITLISRANSDWWLVRTKDDTEGYCYAQYLEVSK